MGKAKAKKSLKKYEVTIIREIEHRAAIEVEAETEDVAKQMALNIADDSVGHWIECDTVSQTFKLKEIK